MPRAVRQRSETGIYHIMLRGVNKQDLFEDDTDRFEFLQTLFRYKQLSDIDLYAYCLMSNYVHQTNQFQLCLLFQLKICSNWTSIPGKVQKRTR